MGSQTQQEHEAEIIDLTNETTGVNCTITLDDSFVPIVIGSDDGTSEDLDIDIKPETSARLILDDESSDASSLPSRIPSSLSVTPTQQSSLSISPTKQSPLSVTLIQQLPSPDSPILNLSSPSSSFDIHHSSSSSISSELIVTPKKSSKTRKTTASKKQADKELRDEAKRLKLKQKEEDKLQKEANRANAANKALINCTACIDKNILNIINDQDEIAMKTLYDESMIIYRITEHPKVDNGLSWTLKRTEVIDGSCVPKYSESSWIMIVMQGSDYLKRLMAYKENSDDDDSIMRFLTNVRNRTQSDIILLVYNLSNYLKSERQKDAKNYRKTFKNKFEASTRDENLKVQDDTTSTTTIGATDLQDLRLMLEIEFKHLHPSWKLHIEFHEKTNEVVQAFVRYTLSIAKLVIKQKARTSTGLDWAINMDKEKAVDPAKSVEDLTKLWITQLQQFSQVTLPIAKAIAAEYPSPFALLNQYESLTTSEAENLLAELYVQRSLKRQIGPNISKRVHCFLTCRDPSVHIGLS